MRVTPDSIRITRCLIVMYIVYRSTTLGLMSRLRCTHLQGVLKILNSHRQIWQQRCEIWLTWIFIFKNISLIIYFRVKYFREIGARVMRVRSAFQFHRQFVTLVCFIVSYLRNFKITKLYALLGKARKLFLPRASILVAEPYDDLKILHRDRSYIIHASFRECKILFIANEYQLFLARPELAKFPF